MKLSIKNMFMLMTLGVVISLLMSSCNSSSPVREDTPYQKDNEAFIETVAKDGAYKQLVFLNESYPIYYKVIESGASDAIRPLQNSEVKIALSGRLIDTKKQTPTGFEFQQPTTLTANLYHISSNGKTDNLIKGVRIALQNMKEGDHWEVIIPWQLGYGMYQQYYIPAYSTLIYDMKLLEVVKQ